MENNTATAKDTFNENDIDYNADEQADADITPLHYHFGHYSVDFDIESLYKKMKEDKIVHPDFQRHFVWKISQASKLIESILLNLPIPPLYFYSDKPHTFQVIDGWQRLMAIYDFFENNFNGQKFRLRLSDDNPLHQKTIDNFSEDYRDSLNSYVLRVVVITPEQHDAANIDAIYEIFSRLNTGGTSLKDQEVRNCVCAGNFNERLKQLNTYENWRLILGKKKEDKRMSDVGLILRCIALLHNHSTYSKPMRSFLTNYLYDNKDNSAEFLEKEELHFKQTCDLIIEKFGEKPFHSRSGINPSILDSVFFAVAQHCSDSYSDYIEMKLSELLVSRDYKDATSKATTDGSVVRRRFKLANSILFE